MPDQPHVVRSTADAPRHDIAPDSGTTVLSNTKSNHKTALHSDDDARVTGRFAPSPTGDFHLGNLRTALLAWALARRAGGEFIMRMEDLDERSRDPFYSRQLADLEAVGIEWDGPVLRQSERLEVYAEHLRALESSTYECYCTRRDLAEAPSAPHQPPGSYPGTCRDLTRAERTERAAHLTNRGPALRLAATRTRGSVTDAILGDYTGTIDDFILRRGDGIYSYNFVSVVDDGLTGVTHIVRGDDLLPSTPRQVYLQELLGLRTPHYAHVPLVLNTKGVRLAKRDGAVTLDALASYGWAPADVVELLGVTLGMDHPRSAREFAEQLEGINLAQGAYLLDTDALTAGPRTVLGR